MLSKGNKQLCQLFAKLLNYPDATLSGEATRLSQQLETSYPEIADVLQSFSAFTKSQSLEALEELYTQTFDVTPATTLYFGYHLFGETPKRSVFLVKLQEAYQACSFSGGTELADHLGVILRFLSVAEDTEFVCPLLEECLLPVLAQMEKELKKTDNPYALVIGPLRMFLRQVSRQLVKTGGVSNA
ncbi:MAG: nitrate reductase molybdenum cofactor assembly chaperone [Chloroflexi bacterium]|nr:nitrate reductase molybdenum cofactor assembly chaperone [Chloroflexota bacterium]